MAQRYSRSTGKVRGIFTGGRTSFSGGGDAPSGQNRIGAQNDQYGNVQRQSAVPPGMMTAPHDWKPFEDAFARNGNGTGFRDSADARAHGFELVPQAGGGVAAVSQADFAKGRSGPMNEAIARGDYNEVKRLQAQQNAPGPTGIQNTVMSASGPRNVAVSPSAADAATQLTGVNPASVSPEQATANLRAAVGQPPAIQQVGSPQDGHVLTQIAPQYQEPGGNIGVTRYPGDPNYPGTQTAFDRPTPPAPVAAPVTGTVRVLPPVNSTSGAPAPAATPLPQAAQPPAPTPSGPPAPVANAVSSANGYGGGRGPSWTPPTQQELRASAAPDAFATNRSLTPVTDAVRAESAPGTRNGPNYAASPLYSGDIQQKMDEEEKAKEAAANPPGAGQGFFDSTIDALDKQNQDQYA